MRQAGERLGRYTLLKRLAVGGMGEVFVAAKPGPVGFGPYVALKILRDELACDPQFVDMLVDEANISMFLNHQNVVSVLDLSEDEGAYYIAMEYVQGITVERLVDSLASNGEHLEIPHALYIAVELCRALKYAHTRVNHDGEPLNIVHRDVTPANILLSIQGEVKLTDFGIARARGRIHQTQAGVLKGKFGYMAPEMVRYERLDARADLFCAGVVMYLMLSGRHPVAGAAVMEAIQRFEQKRIPPPSHFNPEVPAALDTIVMRALEPQPDHRWASAAALGDALRDVMLRTPEWRAHTKDGGHRIVEVIRQVAPAEFDPPVDAETLARLTHELAKSAPGVAFAATAVGPEPEPPTDGAMSIVDEKGAPADLETDEQLPVDDVRVAHEELMRERGASAVADLLEDAAASVSTTAANPAVVVDDSLVVGYPESSPGTARASSDLIAEPSLPADGTLPPLPGGESTSDTADTAKPSYERTESDYVELPEDSGENGVIKEGVIDHPIRLDMANDERTIVNPPSNANDDDGHQLFRPASLPDPSAKPNDDKTVAGRFIPSTDESPPVAAPRSLSPSGLPRIVDTVTNDHAALDGDDASTVVPLYGPGQRRPERTEPSPPLEHMAEVTQLEPIDRSALDTSRSLGVIESRLDSRDEVYLHEETQAGAYVPALEAATIEAQSEELVSAALDAGTSNLEEQRAVEELLSAPSRAASFRGPGTGPIRVLMDADGEVSRIIQAPPGFVDTERDSPAPESSLTLASAGPDHLPSSDGEPTTTGLGHGGAVGADEIEPDMGANTSRWMAGEIDANALAWDDEAAARRAVATRGAAPGSSFDAPPGAAFAAPPGGAFGAPQPGAAFAAVVPTATPRSVSPVPFANYPGRLPVRVSFWERNGMLIGTMLVAFGLLAGLVYAIMFTQVFWPRLKLSSEPAGAVVLIDGVQAPGRTPLVVQVEPERRHRIEFRLEGYQRTLREITEGIGRAKTYTLTVGMDRLPPKVFLPVSGRVFLNGNLTGQGQEVSLGGLSRIQGEVTLRVEAEGHQPYEVLFGSVDEIPAALDVPLRKKSNK